MIYSSVNSSLNSHTALDTARWWRPHFANFNRSAPFQSHTANLDLNHLYTVVHSECPLHSQQGYTLVYPTGSPYCHPPSGWQSMPVFLSSQQPALRITQTWCPGPAAAPCWSWWCWKWEGKGSHCLLLWLSLVRSPRAFYCGTHLSGQPMPSTVELSCQVIPCFLLWNSLVRLPRAFYCGTHLSGHPMLCTVELTCQVTPCFLLWNSLVRSFDAFSTGLLYIQL